MTWQEKAEWLRVHGYVLSIDALEEDDDNRWVASIGGKGRRYALTIEDAISQVYEWITK